jgi:glycerol-3-phosphate acyltransferase PlsY
LSSHEIFFLVFAYLIGSIPFGFIFYYITEKKDIRSQGSGNIGATNVLRQKGKVWGLATLLLDSLKGVIPILYGLKHFDSPIIVIGGGAAAIVGHIFPVFLKFRGGKGVATFVGAVLLFYWPAAALFAALFLLTARLSRYASLASIAGAVSVFFLILFTHIAEVAMVVLLVVILIIVRHRDNIRRIIAGTENKINL